MIILPVSVTVVLVITWGMVVMTRSTSRLWEPTGWVRVVTARMGKAIRVRAYMVRIPSQKNIAFRMSGWVRETAARVVMMVASWVRKTPWLLMVTFLPFILSLHARGGMRCARLPREFASGVSMTITVMASRMREAGWVGETTGRMRKSAVRYGSGRLLLVAERSC